MQTIVSLVSAGMGVALVPQSLCNLRRTGVVYRPLRESVPGDRNRSCVAHSRSQPGPGRLHRYRAHACVAP